MSPRRAPAPCTYPGCPTLVDRGRCAEHKAEQDQPYKQTEDYRQRQAVYASPQWRTLRGRITRERGIWCDIPDCPNLGTDLDHIRPLREILAEDGDPFDPLNVTLLCKRHHSQKTANEVVRRT
jgi:5-methylcytosine-specific restriction enzyme A